MNASATILLLTVQAPPATASADLALARSAAAGDTRAVRRVLERVGPHVLAAVRSTVGARHSDVEDLVQESFIALLRALGSFRGEASLEHFAKGVAVRRAIDGLRAAARARRNAQLGAEDPVVAQPPDLAVRRQRQWRELLGELSAEQAEALALRAVEGYSIEEISAVTGAPIETVRSRLRLAKASLRERIAAEPALGDLLPKEEP